MAQMIPRVIQFKKSPAEVRMFARLRDDLPDEYVVLHHLQWLQRQPAKLSPDAESDFVILHPERGALTLEVKGGEMRYDKERGKWISRARSGEEHVGGRDPYEEAREGNYCLIRFAKALKYWPRDWGPFGYAVCFPDGKFDSAPLGHTNLEVTIDGPDVFDPVTLRERIEQAFEWYRRDRLRPDQRGLDLLVEGLAHDIDIRQPLSMIIDEADREILSLSEHQYRCLNFLEGNTRVAVAGPAGSGKTLLALEKARRLATRGQHVLLTCFNRPLAEYLAALPVVRQTDGLEIGTFFQICGRLAHQAGIRMEADPEDPAVFDELPGVLEAAADLLGPHYDAIVVDEAQDFDESWWLPMLTLLRDPDEGTLYVFFDDNQAIYRRPTKLPDRLMSFRLFENWRNTQQIFEAVMRFYEGEGVTPLGPEGPQVRTVGVEPGTLPRELSRQLHHLTVDEGVPSSDITVLTARSASASEVIGTIGMFQLVEEPSSPNDIRLSSIYRFKGLDAKAVIVCECDMTREDLRELLYVACSRARALLTILMSKRPAS